MPSLSSTTLPNGGRVVLSLPDALPANGSYQLTADLFDAKGALVRSIAVDTARDSDGTTAPARSETFSNFQVVSVSGGGFAIGYDDLVQNPPSAQNQAEVHIYDAAGGLKNIALFGTSNPNQLFPIPGQVALTTSSANDVYVLVHGADDQQHLTRTDDQIHERLYDVRPSGLYDTGPAGNIVVTVARTQLGNPLPALTREVLDSHFNLIGSSGVIETLGDAGANTISGGAGADNISGGAGDDVLKGGDGYDILTGGSGADRFLFTLDGSTDQVTDFDRTVDKLALVDDSGAPIASSTGVLTFYRATGLLTYDADGDNGPAAAQAIASLPGVKNLNATNLAPGFEPAVLRVFNPVDASQVGFGGQGSRSDIVYGFGHTNFVQAEADYSPAQVLLQYTVDFTDHTRSQTTFDKLNQQEWDHVVGDFAPNGQLSVYATYADDGTHVLWRFDANGDQPWQRIVDHYDAQGRQLSREVVADDNSHWAAVFDVANTQPWGYEVDFFDTAGALTSRSFFNDDGTPFHA
jgi:hypothetical protein